MNIRDSIWISVFGGRTARKEIIIEARRVGELIADAGAVVVCGGLGGVMEAIASGAKEGGGIVVGIIPSANRNDANSYIDIAIPTGLGIARNLLIARAGDAAIAIDGKWGTLSEIALTMNLGKEVIGLHTFELDGIIGVDTPEDAVKKALKAAKRLREKK